jgi:hypothetical protein
VPGHLGGRLVLDRRLIGADDHRPVALDQPLGGADVDALRVHEEFPRVAPHGHATGADQPDVGPPPGFNAPISPNV